MLAPFRETLRDLEQEQAHLANLAAAGNWSCVPGFRNLSVVKVVCTLVKYNLLTPWIFWELQYRKRTLHHSDNRRFPVETLRRQMDIHKFTVRRQAASPSVYLYLPCYLLSIFPPQWPEGEGGNGRDHYITKHPQASILSNCHTRLLIHCLQASGQVLCAMLQTQGGWEEKVEDGKKEENEK